MIDGTYWHIKMAVNCRNAQVIFHLIMLLHTKLVSLAFYWIRVYISIILKVEMNLNFATLYIFIHQVSPKTDIPNAAPRRAALP